MIGEGYFSKFLGDDCKVLKGAAMLIIVLHNYLNWTVDIGCNEMKFDSNRIFDLFSRIDYNIFNVINLFIVYFGFYVLYFFIFFSGYGLSKKYKDQTKLQFKKYFIPRVVNIYSLLAIGLIFVILFIQNPIHFEGDFDLRANITFALYHLSMLGSISDSTLYKFPLAGPWWYFALAIQLYLLFPLVHKIIGKYKLKGFYVLILISLLLIYVLQPIFSRLGIMINTNFVGHLPVFILGIGFAKLENYKISWQYIAICVPIIILSQFYSLFYPVSFLAACIILLKVSSVLITDNKSVISKIFTFLGSISMFMFVLNGPIREFTIRNIFNLPNNGSLDIFRDALIHLAIVVLVSWITSLIYAKTLGPWSSRLSAFLVGKK